MGDENSLQGRTQAHKHESASSTGGYLETGVTGMTNLSTGSMVYGDASEIVTELPVASNGDVLELSAGLPTWQTPAGGSGAYELLGSTELGAPASDQTLTWASESFADIAAVDIFFSCVTPSNLNGIQFQLNGITSASYDFDGTYVSGGVSSSINGAGLIRVYSPTNSQYFTGHIRVICQDPSNTSGAAPILMYSGNITSVDASSMYNFGGHLNGLNISASDGVRIYPPAGNLSTGSVITAYKLNRT